MSIGEGGHTDGVLDPISNVLDPALEAVLDPGGVLDLGVSLDLGGAVTPGGVLDLGWALDPNPNPVLASGGVAEPSGVSEPLGFLDAL